MSCNVVQVEYDLEESGKDDLRVLSTDRIEQSSVALCMEWYPPVTKESFIFTANDQVSGGRKHRCQHYYFRMGNPAFRVPSR